MKLFLVSVLVFVSLDGFAAEKDEHYIIVMAYHSFTGKSEYKTDISMNDLQEHMLFFKRKGFAFASFSDLLKGRLVHRWNLLVTIDDGNRSVYPAFCRVFKPLGIRPLLGIYPGVIGKSHALTWEMLKKLTEDGCEIASHGYYHRYVSENLFRSNPLSFKKEVFGSKSELEERLGVPVRVFMYPFGVYSDLTVGELKKAGYTAAFSIKWGVIKQGPDFVSRRYELPRYMFMDNWDMLKRVVVKEMWKTRRIKKEGSFELP